MIPFVVIFLLAGVLLVVVGGKAQRDAKRAETWPKVSGHLERCEVVQLPGIGNDASSWQLELRYSYEVRGKTYHSTRYAFGYGDGSAEEKHRRIADALIRSPLFVHYDPARPSEAVISTVVQTNLSKLGYATLTMAVISALVAMVCF